MAEEAVLREKLEGVEGLEFLSFDETDEGYVKVVLRQGCESGCDAYPHRRYVYHVGPEPHIDGGVHLHWTFIGEAATD